MTRKDRLQKIKLLIAELEEIENERAELDSINYNYDNRISHARYENISKEIRYTLMDLVNTQ